jgi:osmotically-inducible protein OsmY
MNTRTKTIVMAAALIAAGSALSSQAADQTDTTQTDTSRITVYAKPTTDDQQITNDVVEKLANDPRLAGYIGVETDRHNVTLTGRVITPGQVEDARRDAESVKGVTDVDAAVQPRVGEGF